MITASDEKGGAHMRLLPDGKARGVGARRKAYKRSLPLLDF
jgi:hypothetical protein